MCILIAFEIDSEVRGCYVYKDVWSAAIDSKLPYSSIAKTGVPFHTHALMH